MMIRLPGNPYYPPGCSAKDIDGGCLPDGKMHCKVCNEICDEAADDMCPKHREEEHEKGD